MNAKYQIRETATLVYVSQVIVSSTQRLLGKELS